MSRTNEPCNARKATVKRTKFVVGDKEIRLGPAPSKRRRLLGMAQVGPKAGEKGLDAYTVMKTRMHAER